MLVVDAANVIGSRPTGWWKDRPGAARTFVERVRNAVRKGQLTEPVVVVLEGMACDGAEPGVADGVTVIHAPRSGDDMVLEVIADADAAVTLVTADRALSEKARDLGADVVRPGWFLGRLDD